MPTSCTGPLRSDVETDSWENPGVFLPPFQYVSVDNLEPSGRHGRLQPRAVHTERESHARRAGREHADGV